MKGSGNVSVESSLDVAGAGIEGMFSCAFIGHASFPAAVGSLRERHYLVTRLDSVFKHLTLLDLHYLQAVCVCMMSQ